MTLLAEQLIAFLSMNAALVLLLLAVLRIRRDGWSNGLARSYGLNAIAGALWTGTYALMYLSRDAEQVRMLYRVSSLGWASIPFTTAHLGTWLWHSWKGRKVHPLVSAALLAAIPVFVGAALQDQLLATGFTRLGIGWAEHIDYQYPLDLSWVMLAALSPLYAVLAASVLRPMHLANKQRLQIRWFVLPGVLAGIGSVCFNLILPLLFEGLPVLGHLFTAAWFLATGLALHHYAGLADLSPSFAAESVIMNMSDMLYLVDREGGIRSANPMVRTLQGLDPEALKGSSIDELLVDSSMEDLIARLEQSGEPIPLQIRTAGTAVLPCSCLVRPLSDRFRDHVGYMVLLRDMRETNQLVQAAETDHLTGLWNRERMRKAVILELERYHRYRQDFVVLMLDLDHFKDVNDTHGHLFGDKVLVEACRRIKRCLRTSDLLGRWGGEEFLVLCPQSGRAEAMTIAERIRAAMARDLFDRGIRLTISIGVAASAPEDTVEYLLERADQAMYCAKRGGRNRVDEGCGEQKS